MQEFAVAVRSLQECTAPLKCARKLCLASRYSSLEILIHGYMARRKHEFFLRKLPEKLCPQGDNNGGATTTSERKEGSGKYGWVEGKGNGRGYKQHDNKFKGEAQQMQWEMQTQTEWNEMQKSAIPSVCVCAQKLECNKNYLA